MSTFRYTLRTPDGAITFGTDEVQNWQDVKPSLVKNETYRGIYFVITSTIEFAGFARETIIRTIDRYGNDAPLFLTIEVGNDNREQSSFKVYRGMENMKADTGAHERSENYVALNFIVNDFVADIINRDDISMNMDITETIEGDELPSYESILWDSYLHDRGLLYISEWENEWRKDVVNQPTALTTQAMIAVPSDIKFRSGENINSVPYGITDYQNNELDPLNSLLSNAPFSGKIRMKVRTRGLYYFPAPGAPELEEGFGLVGSFTATLRIGISYATPRNGSTGEPVVTFIPNQTVDVNFNTISYDIDWEGEFDIQQGDSIQFGLFMFNFFSGASFEAHKWTYENKIELNYDAAFPATQTKVLLPHEAFERLTHIITGKSNAFKSDFFGRTDLGYEKDGAGAYNAISNGKMIRSFPFDECHPSLSLQSLFEEFSKLHNLIGFIDIVDNQQVFRIEKYDTYYSRKVGVKIKKTVEVSMSPNPDMMFSNIRVGSRERELEELNGLYSYNGEFNFATPFRADAEELNLIMEFITSDLAIEVTRRQQYQDNPDKDYRFDDDIFIIDSKKVTGTIDFNGETINVSDKTVIPVRDEDYEIIEGTFRPSQAYNLNLSPGVMLRNWGSVIKSALIQKESEKLKFLEGAKNQNLVTKKVGEKLLIQKADVNVSDLKTPIFFADIILIAEGEISKDDWDYMINNQSDFVEFTNKGIQIYGVPKLAEFDFQRKTCNFEIERANF